ncbi:HTH-type transcriptional regulator LutR [Baekduia alba]|uniref:FadR/GntR family transcriptional regulator n=1 Tax=Baekduia alba TaxID=2997333 RepID=UPI002341E429|nr:FCD domain-containing protein [Baekduia alba]WCB92273.1 HTH-type transcriptional regulator LutR [Baekduia alba]
MPVVPRQISRQTAAEAVRDQLLALIQAGTYPVDTKLPSEQELARSFGVSRPIVREALGTLRAAGVLESLSGSGSFVRATEPTKSGLLLLGHYSPDDLHEVRTHLEVPAAGLAAKRRTAGQLAALEEIVARHATRTDVVDWVQDDLAFHVALAEASGNELQAKLVAELRELQFEQTVVMARIAGGLGVPEAEHRAILDAVGAQDAAAARKAMTAHLVAIRQRSSVAREAPPFKRVAG